MGQKEIKEAKSKLREEIKNEMKSNPEINIIVELEKVLGEDKIIYNKTL